MSYGKSISPICLPTSSFADLYTGKNAVVVGWGTLKEGIVFQKHTVQLRFFLLEEYFEILGGVQPDVLQQVTVRVTSNAECQKKYGTDAPGGIARHMMCAASTGKDACSVRMNGCLIVTTIYVT